MPVFEMLINPGGIQSALPYLTVIFIFLDITAG